VIANTVAPKEGGVSDLPRGVWWGQITGDSHVVEAKAITIVESEPWRVASLAARPECPVDD
jgi:hypothetical protein